MGKLSESKRDAQSPKSVFSFGNEASNEKGFYDCGHLQCILAHSQNKGESLLQPSSIIIENNCRSSLSRFKSMLDEKAY